MHRLMWVVAVGGVVVAACGDNKGGSSTSPGSTSPAESTTSTSVVPKTGGVLTMATYVEPAGLDPTVSLGGGQTGGIELAAIYDVLTRWNPETKGYEGVT